MSKRDPFLLLEDIHEAINMIQEYTKDINKDTFLSDSKTIDAVVRNLEIIGEAMNRIVKVYPDIPIKDSKNIIGLRNQIIHAYDNISDEYIWSVISKHLPVLKSEVEKLIQGE